MIRNIGKRFFSPLTISSRISKEKMNHENILVFPAEKSIEDSMPDGVVKAAHFSYNDSEKERLQTEAWETLCKV